MNNYPPNWRVFFGAILCLFTACNNPLWTDEAGALHTLHQHGYTETKGYTDIKVGGFNLWGCNGYDAYRTKFSAKIDGKAIQGVVCSGLIFKKSAIRIY